MSVANQIGRALIDKAKAKLDHDMLQTWTALCLMDTIDREYAPAGVKGSPGWRRVEDQLLLAGVQATANVIAWIVEHSRHQHSFQMLWCAMLSEIAHVKAIQRLSMRHLEEQFLKSGFPTIDDMQAAWASQMTLKGAELDFSRNWL